MKINNLPDNYKNYAYVVARKVDGDLWFWGCYNDRNRANETALEEGGETWESAIVERGDF